MSETLTNVPAPTPNVIRENGVPTMISAGDTSEPISAATVAVEGAALPGVNVMKGDLPLHTISILVENTPGILARVAHVFARRGFNVESLAVSRTEDPTVSRMTVVVAGDDEAFTQMGKQLMKLIDVIKVRAGSKERAEVMQIAEAFRAAIVDVSPETLMLEVTGKSGKIDAMQRMLGGFEILELVRTGLIVLMRGEKQT